MNVLVLPPFNAAQKTVLEAGAPGATFVYSDYHSATDEQIAAADVIVGNLAPKRLCRAARLQLLQLNSAGYDNYAAAETLPRGARVCCAVGAYGQAVSEHIFSMVLAIIKRLPAYHTDQLSHTWSDHGPVTSLRGARAGDGHRRHRHALCPTLPGHGRQRHRHKALCRKRPPAF